jgi:uncharacterized membrane protein YoaK (UPF0700 family)
VAFLVRDPRHGPLPGLLLILTVVTGLVDAVSILALGRVFVANMTGNVAFVGFALAGAPGFSLSASLFALAGFLVGAVMGGQIISRSADRGLMLSRSVAAEVVLMAVAAVISQIGTVPYGTATKDAVAAVTAVAMGVQNAMARRLAVPDMTTTVLTMTLTGLASDVRTGNTSAVVRRLLAVSAMLIGAVAGALLVLHVRPSAALEVAVGLTAVVGVGAFGVTRRPHPWRSAV